MRPPKKIQAAALAVAIGLTSSITLAQSCPSDDVVNEPNDDCSTPALLPASPATGLAVTATSDDYWSLTVPAMTDVTLDVLFSHANVDVDLVVWDATCANLVAQSLTVTDNEAATWTNLSASPQNYVLFIDNFGNVTTPPAACGNYAITYSTAPSMSACLTAPDDSLEENDSCGTASMETPGLVGTGLFVIQGDDDYYRVTVPGNMAVTANSFFVSGNGDLDLEIYDASCSVLLDQGVTATDNESVFADNASAAPVDFVVRVHVWSGSTIDCNSYDLNLTLSSLICAGPEDMYEENDLCTSAAPLLTGTTAGLLVLKDGIDTDFFTIDVPPGATITVTCNHLAANGDVDLALYDDCSQVNPFNPLDFASTINDMEVVSDTNASAGTKNYFFETFVWAGDSNDCNTYDLVVDLSGGGPGNIVPYCFGDGAGTPCPCGNNSSAGHPGGCANSAGNGGVLTAIGIASVASDTLNLDLASASQNSFALLVSGNNALPQTGGCIGCGLSAFDGLRCAGGGFLRHGSRATNGMGQTGNGWGPPGGPAGGLIAANGFTAGQSKNFFAFYRENAMFVCMTGQNSSNGISITFQP